VRFGRIVPVALMVGLGSLAGFSSGPAHAADTSTGGLPLNGEYQMVVDNAHQRLFISQGSAGGDDGVLVTTFGGASIATLSGPTEGLALSADDDTLYMAGPDAVTAISTASFQRIASYPTPGPASWVAVQSGQLWVSYWDASADRGEIGSINLTTGTASWDVVPGDWADNPPLIAVDPSDTGVLATSSVGVSPSTVATYNVAGSSVVPIASSTSVDPIAATADGCGYHGLSVLPGGATLLCGGFPYSTATLTAQDPSGHYYGTQTAVAPDGAFAEDYDNADAADVQVYPAGGTAPTASYYQFPDVPVPPYPNPASFAADFAWASDSQRLFTVVESVTNQPGSPVFSVVSLYPFEQVPTELWLGTSAASVGYNGTVSLLAYLGFTNTNRAIALYETPAGEPRKLLWSGAVTASGYANANAVETLTRDTTFTEVFTGDARYLPGTTTATVQVRPYVASAISGYYKTAIVSGLDYHLYHRDGTLKDLATITPANPGQCVRLEIQQADGYVWKPDTTTGCAALNNNGQATIPRALTTTGWYRLRVDFTPTATATNAAADSGWLYYTIPS
jgi:hypothetical protein